MELLLLLATMILLALAAMGRFRMLGAEADRLLKNFRQTAAPQYRCLMAFLMQWDAPSPKLQHKADKLETLINRALSEPLKGNDLIVLDNQILSEIKVLVKDAEMPCSDQAAEALRKEYNLAAVKYNHAVFLFPSNVFALVFGYKKKLLFQTDPQPKHQDLINAG